METYEEKKQDTHRHAVSENNTQKNSLSDSNLIDKRPEAILQMKIKERINNSPKVNDLKKLQVLANSKSPNEQVAQLTPDPKPKKEKQSVSDIDQEKLKVEDWTVTKDTWQGDGKEMHEQFKSDAIIWFNTMFGKTGATASRVGENITKKLFLTIALADLKVSTEQELIERVIVQKKDKETGKMKNTAGTSGTQKHDPSGTDRGIPLAAQMSHGGRINVQFPEEELTDSKGKKRKGNVSQEFSDEVFGGNLSKRGFASHTSSIDKEGHIKESKLSKLQSMGTQHKTAPMGNFGGLNSPAPGENQNKMGERGKVLAPDGTRARGDAGKMTQGHLYVNDKNVGTKGQGNIMWGVESSRPMHDSGFGVTHDANSANHDQTESKSATGGSKNAKLFKEEIAEYSGKIAKVDKTTLEIIKERSSMILNLPEEEQMVLFKKILLLPPSDAKIAIMEYKPLSEQISQESSSSESSN